MKACYFPQFGQVATPGSNFFPQLSQNSLYFTMTRCQAQERKSHGTNIEKNVY